MATTQKNLTELVVGDTIIDVQGTVHHITALEQYTEYEDNPEGDWGMRIFTNTYPAGRDIVPVGAPETILFRVVEAVSK